MKTERRRLRYEWRVFSYAILISFIITFNLFFNVFVWMPHDLPQIMAIGFVSFLMIILIVYNWIKDRKEIQQEV